MKKLFYAFLTLLILQACNNNSNTQEKEQNTSQDSTNQEIISEEDIPVNTENQGGQDLGNTPEEKNVLGSYIGMFVAEKYKEGGSVQNKINISLDAIEGDFLIGHSVVAGNNRPFEGPIDWASRTATVAEPGDDKYDGSFVFKISEDCKEIVGTWKANNENLKVNERSFELKKKIFEYNPDLNLTDMVSWSELYDAKNASAYLDDYAEGEYLTDDVMLYNASNTALKKADIENMYKGDLEVIRNSIYARHGYSFKNRKMRYVFDKVDWYIPVSTDVRSQLTDLEKKNIDLLKRYEGHAERYYDSFGR